jgi:hypothetical protein
MARSRSHGDDAAMRAVCPTCLGVGHIAVERHSSIHEIHASELVVYPICTTCEGLSWLYNWTS